jgi:hypothetical protein
LLLDLPYRGPKINEYPPGVSPCHVRELPASSLRDVLEYINKPNKPHDKKQSTLRLHNSVIKKSKRLKIMFTPNDKKKTLLGILSWSQLSLLVAQDF